MTIITRKSKLEKGRKEGKEENDTNIRFATSYSSQENGIFEEESSTFALTLKCLFI